MTQGIECLKLGCYERDVCGLNAGDGLEQSSSTGKALLLRNLSYIINFINLIINRAEELFFKVYFLTGV